MIRDDIKTALVTAMKGGDKPATVKRLLQDAAKDSGMRIRSSWSDTRQQVLFWKKVGSR